MPQEDIIEAYWKRTVSVTYVDRIWFCLQKAQEPRISIQPAEDEDGKSSYYSNGIYSGITLK
jgi:hypothetical protein